MSPTMQRLRHQLEQLIESAAAEAEAQRLHDQQLAAQAIEEATSATAVGLAYEQGRQDRNREVLTLITEHRQTLARGGVNAISLETLGRIIEGGQG